MTTKKLVGVGLIALPFAVIIASALKYIGVKGTLVVLVATAAFVSCVYGGFYLLESSKPKKTKPDGTIDPFDKNAKGV